MLERVVRAVKTYVERLDPRVIVIAREISYGFLRAVGAYLLLVALWLVALAAKGCTA